ncbi:MAG: hypothetical protein ACOZE5_16235 [Verrucomicrobiota bacterium]
MSVIPLTVFFSLLLAGLFVVLFIHEQRRRLFTSPEHDSLLPLADETPRPAIPPPEGKRSHGPHDRAPPASLPPGYDEDDYF